MNYSRNSWITNTARSYEGAGLINSSPGGGAMLDIGRFVYLRKQMGDVYPMPLINYKSVPVKASIK